jgi:hypothetical protein
MEFDLSQKNVLLERHCRATEKSETSEAIACARRCRSSRLTRWWTQKNNVKKWRAEEAERHKGFADPTKNSGTRMPGSAGQGSARPPPEPKIMGSNLRGV